MVSEKESISEKGTDQKEIKVEEKKVEKEVKKLDDVKDTPENKKAIVESEGKVEEKKDEKKDSKPAVAKISKKKKKSIIELEREYVVPLKKGCLNVPRYRRAKKAVRVLKEFLAKHMKIEGRDLKKVKIDLYLNNEIWFKGIKKPMNKIKVKAVKREGIVYAELAEIPEAVKFVKARADKRSATAKKTKVKVPKKAKEEEKSEAEKVEEKEDVKAGAEKGAKLEKMEVKNMQHTAQGKHAQKTMPVRKALKK